MKPLLLIACCALALSGCGTVTGLVSGVSSPFSGGGGIRGAKSEVGGIRFRTRIAASTQDGRGFVTLTAGAARGVAEAAEAGRVQAVTYCLRLFGGSAIAWTRGPEDTLSLTDGALVMSGVCITR